MISLELEFLQKFYKKGVLMSDTQLEWTIFRVDEQDLESKLNELSSQDYEVFSVQFTGSYWTIVVRKSIKNKGGKTMGFSAGN